MINPSFEELEKISKSRYEISLLLMKRARLLVAGSEPRIETDAKKPVTIALDEFVGGKVWKKGHRPEIPEDEENQDEEAESDSDDEEEASPEKDDNEDESDQETEEDQSAEE